MVNFEDSILFHEMKKQLRFLKDELKIKNETLNTSLKDKMGIKI